MKLRVLDVTLVPAHREECGHLVTEHVVAVLEYGCDTFKRRSQGVTSLATELRREFGEIEVAL